MERACWPVAAFLAALLAVPVASAASGSPVSWGASAAMQSSGAGPASATVGSATALVSGAFVDPELVRLLAHEPRQVAILVVDPSMEPTVLSALRTLALPLHLYDELHMVAVVVAAGELGTVAHLPGVLAVYRNERMQALLDRSADYVGAPTVWSPYGVTGRGVTILVMDSGIDATHPDLEYGEKVLENVVPNRQSSGLVGGSKEGIVSSDPDGHGTHVAGIIAGTGKALDGRYRGVAWGAQLVGYQAGVLRPGSEEVSFESVTVLEGFNWALANRAKHGVRIVSNSWGANGDFDPRSPVNIATLNLYREGILVLFAAGNEGDEGGHSLNKYAVAPWVLGVTAGDFLNHVPRFASRGSSSGEGGLPYDHPDLVAPGVAITSARAAGGDARSLASRYYTTKSGSSMAVPHVAGVAALLLEANPYLSPDDLMDVLTSTATPLPSSPLYESGAGFVNALHAYQLAKRTSGQRDPFLRGNVKYAGPASGDPAFARDAVSVGYQQGQPTRLKSPDHDVDELLHRLVSTAAGWTLLAGTLALVPAALGPGGGRPAARPVAGGPAAPNRSGGAPPWANPVRVAAPGLLGRAAHVSAVGTPGSVRSAPSGVTAPAPSDSLFAAAAPASGPARTRNS